MINNYTPYFSKRYLPYQMPYFSPKFQDNNYSIAKEKFVFSSKTDKQENQPIIEFHGIKLYSDDLLILILINFLYKENIDDFMLYILLFTLLLE